MSGTGSQAKVKDLVVYASGDRKTIARLRPLFAAFSRQLHDLGAFGNGSRMKYVANLLVAIHNVASAEAMVLGMKAGLDPKRVFELATAGAGNSRVLELRGPMMVKDRYDDPTMKVSTWQKDMAVIGQYAASARLARPRCSAPRCRSTLRPCRPAMPRTTRRPSARCSKQWQGCGAGKADDKADPGSA